MCHRGANQSSECSHMRFRAEVRRVAAQESGQRDTVLASLSKVGLVCL